MPEELYQIRYQVVDEAGSKIDRLASKIGGFDAVVQSSAASLALFGKNGGSISQNLAVIANALDQLPKAQGIAGLKTGIEGWGRSIAGVRQNLAGLQADLMNIGKANAGLVGVENAVLGLGRTFDATRGNVGQFSQDLSALKTHRAGLDNLGSGVQGVQRKLYGAFKNAQDLGGQLSTLSAKGSGLSGLTSQMAPLRKGINGATASARRFGPAIDGWIARIATIQGVRAEVERLGKALRDGQDATQQGGRANLDTRDHYRELGNLLGKDGPTNEVVGAAMRVRIATGLSDHETNDALRRFQGGISSAEARGNITGNAVSGEAGDFLREGLRTGLRVDVKGSTSALLAAKLAQGEKIESADQGVGRMATILDTLNRGDGDLDPLVASLIKGSGGYVGKGRAFPNLEEFAAAQSVTSLNASPAVSATRVQQAYAGMQTLMADEKLNAKLKLSPSDFASNIDNLAPLVEGKENQDLELSKLGIDNRASRRSILQLIGNRDILRRETNAVRKGSDAKAVRGQNDRFFASDTAQDRIARAQVDAAKFVQFNREEPTVVMRERAETALRNRREIDTPITNAQEAVADSPFTRTLTGLTGLAMGRVPGMDDLPLFLGGKPARQRRLDAEAERIAREQAAKSGLNPARSLTEAFGDALTTPEERIPELVRRTREAGGDPFGKANETDALLRQLIRESQNQTALLKKQQQQPNFLPINPRAPAPPGRPGLPFGGL